AAFDEDEARELEQIYEGQTRFGLAVEKLSGDEVRRRLPQVSPCVISGLFLAHDAWLNNELLVSALHKACRAVGVAFHAHSPMARFNATGERIESISVESGPGQAPASYSADYFVLAAGAWSGELAATLDLRLPVKPCRGQMIELEGAEGFPFTVRAGHFYCVPRSGGRLIVGSTMEYSGFEKAVTVGGLLSILERARRLTPEIANLRFCRAWSGLRPDTADHRPILGRGKRSNLVFATGHFRNGILLTPITARLVAELILTGSPPLSLQPYSPLRFQS
ncbi:MAG: NAD(P)/FAD-dependent oxidoreductase, partial [Terriglobia bacterium]